MPITLSELAKLTKDQWTKTVLETILAESPLLRMTDEERVRWRERLEAERRASGYYEPEQVRAREEAAKRQARMQRIHDWAVREGAYCECDDD